MGVGSSKVGWVALLLTALSFLPTLKAQESTGTVLGTVTDPSGAALPGVKVIVVDELRGFTRSTATDDHGVYVVPLLLVGRYRVQAEATSFQRFVQTGVALDVNQKARIDIVMHLGSLEQTVTVEEGTLLVDTTNSTLGGLVAREEIVDLPLNGRNFTQLGVLLPGTASAPERISGGLNSNTAYTVNGQRTQSNNFLLDGATNNDLLTNGFAAVPPPDALQEFKILTHNYSPEYGRNSGSVVNVITRSGENEFHGSVWEFLRNDALDARNFFDDETAKLRRSQFGFSLGGPIVRDQTLFFGFYEGLRERLGQTQTVPVLSPEERGGDFAALNPAPASCAEPGAVCDPLTGNPFPGNVIPSDRLDPVALALLEALVPLPNSLGNRFVNAPTLRSDGEQLGLRVDHRFGAANNIFARYHFSDGETLNPIGEANFMPAGSSNVNRVQSVTVTEMHVFSPSVLNEVSLSFLRQDSQPATWSGVNPADFGFLYPTTEPTAFGMPFVELSGLFSLGDVQQNFTQVVRNTYQVLDNFTYLRGRHNFKMGLDIRREQIFLVFPNRPNGDFLFSGTFTGLPAADFLLGAASRFRQGGGDPSRHLFGTQVGFYWQDDFHALPRLTLSFGVRYELTLPYYDKYNRMGSFQPGRQSVFRPNAPQNLLYPEDPGVPRATIATDKNNFSPRIGLAWDPWGDGRTSLRAGYGLLFDVIPGWAPFQNILAPPFTRFANLDGPPSFADPFVGISPSPLVDPALEFPCPCLVIGYSPDFTSGYAQHYNLTLQREMRRNFLFEVGYVGSTTTKFPGYLEINPALQTPDATLQNAQSRRIYPAYTLVRLTFSRFNSNYNSLQVSLNKRLSQGYTFRASYTWSKAIDTQSNVNLGDDRPQDAFSLSDVRGRAIFDVRHRFVLSGLWNLPGLKEQPVLVRYILGGWQLSGILTFQTGFPLTAREPTDRSLRALRADRPDQVCNPDTGPKTVQEWFATECFVRLPPRIPGGQRSGTAGRNTITGPDFKNVDLALIKKFPLSERQQLQFRTEFFNVFNHPNFKDPATLIGTSTFGQIDAAHAPRIIQFGLKYLF